MSIGTRAPFTSTKAIQDCWITGASSGLPSRFPNQWMPIEVANRSRLLTTTAENRTARIIGSGLAGSAGNGLAFCPPHTTGTRDNERDLERRVRASVLWCYLIRARGDLRQRRDRAVVAPAPRRVVGARPLALSRVRTRTRRARPVPDPELGAGAR